MNTPAVAPAPPVGPGAPAAPDPGQQLLAEVGRLRVRSTGRDRLLLRLGAGLMGLGPVLTVVGYLQSSQTSSPFNQNDAIIVALVGVSLSIVGVALFLRYSLGEFLRFWMARLLAEQHTPRPVAPVPGRRPGPPPAMANGAAAPPPPPRQEMP